MNDYYQQGFSLIEILLVIIIISVLSGIFFFFFNYSEINRINRDVQRLNDLSVLRFVIDNLNLDALDDLENNIYLSLPDTTSSCANYNLNTIYSPFAYKCQPAANLRNTDSSGWLPINMQLQSIVGINSLPLDPLNNEQYFYAFQVKDKKYKLSARLESSSKGTEMVYDGGSNLTLYEVGSGLNFASVHDGLVGAWHFDEQSTSTLLDSSLYNNGGFSKSGSVNFDLHTTSTCKIGYCLRFDGVDDYALISNSPVFNFSNKGFTLLAWIKIENLNASSEHFIISRYNWSNGSGYGMQVTNTGKIRCDFNGSSGYFLSNESYVQPNNWYLIGCVYDGQSLKIFVNGKEKEAASRSNLINAINSNIYIGTPADAVGSDNFSFQGMIDEVYIYNRPLNEQEINLIYQFRPN